MLGSTVYDAGANSTVWIRVVQSDVLGPVAIETLGLVAVVLVVFGLYLGAVTLAGVLGGDAAQVREMPGLFASSIVPIALGYVVAHYYSLLVLTGQQTVGFLADPLGLGCEPAGPGRPSPPHRLGAADVRRHLPGGARSSSATCWAWSWRTTGPSRCSRARSAVVGQIPLLCLMVAVHRRRPTPALRRLSGEHRHSAAELTRGSISPNSTSSSVAVAA